MTDKEFMEFLKGYLIEVEESIKKYIDNPVAVSYFEGKRDVLKLVVKED